MSEVKAYRIDECARMIEDSEPDEDSWIKWEDAQSELAALREELAQKVVLSIRDICELEPADSDDPECIQIKASDLGAILSRHFEGIE